MWLGIGYLIPMKGDKAGEPLPKPDFIIAENNDFLITELSGDKMIPEIA
jgi:hypothetical protein